MPKSVMKGNPMKCRRAVSFALASVLLGASVVAWTGKVAVIAPSLSTAREARTILRKRRWTEAEPKEADAILVVVRSSLSYPLGSSYASFRELERDAENQLNITGPKFHVYIYGFNSDRSVSEVDHASYPVDE